MQEINPHANFLALRERLAANVLGQQGLVDA